MKAAQVSGQSAVLTYMLKVTAVLSLCLLGACAQPYAADTGDLTPAPKTIGMDIRVKADGIDAEAVLEAAAQWREATGGLVRFSVELVDRDNGTGVYIDTDTSSEKSLGSTTCLGCYPSVMLLNPPLIASRKDSTVGVIMHELGHVLDLDHAPRGLMYPTDGVEWATCVDVDTLTAFCAAHDCPAAAHATCPAK